MVRQIVDASSGDVLTLSLVKSTIQVSEAASPRTRFESYLSSQQVDLVRAVSILFGGERSKVAKFFATDVNAVSSKMQ